MINLHDILQAGNGQLFGDAAAEIFTDFCFDSRRVNPGELFVALRTERGDGHPFMAEAVRGGARGILCMRPPEFDTSGLSVVVTRDVEAALLGWARIVLQKFNTTVIAVTGSAGKTTTKEAIAAVLNAGERHQVYKSPDSYNGRFGLPLALGKLTAEHRLAVLEFGTDRFGEMAQLVEATAPRVAVVTNMGHKHTARLGTLEAIAAENAVLIHALPTDGVALLNYDDDLTRGMAAQTQARTFTFGLDRDGNAFGADLIAYNIEIMREKTAFDLRYGRERYVGCWVPLPGAHQLYSVLAALAVGLQFGVPLQEGLQALTEFEPLPGRLRPLDGLNGSLLLDDTYNASPESTLAALDFLAALRRPERGERAIFVLGEMDDLGGYAVHAHTDVGRRAAHAADMIIACGDTAAIAARAALESGLTREQVRVVYGPADAAALLASLLTPETIVLVKGGIAARMERVVAPVLARPEDRALLPRQESVYAVVRAQSPPRPTWIEIDQGAIAGNVRRLRDHIGPETALMAVVKANAFGHGAVAVSTTALLNGATHLGVATVNEGVELRESGITAPILVLGYTPPYAGEQAIRYDLRLTLYDLELARLFNRAAADMDAQLYVHIKLDTGMSRLGLLPDQVIPFFRALPAMKHIEAEGLFTHFSVADDDPAFTLQQLEAFQRQVAVLRASGIAFRYLHAANSAATLRLPETHLSMVRVGLAMYGLDPGVPLLPGMRPALTWKTSVAQVKTLAPGTFVGYGNTWRANNAATIAVIPVGYADSFRRGPANWGDVLVHGKRAPLVGRVSMDQAMIDVTQIQDVVIGDEVILIGVQGDDRITADDVAERLGTSNYEVVSTILARVPRL